MPYHASSSCKAAYNVTVNIGNNAQLTAHSGAAERGNNSAVPRQKDVSQSLVRIIIGTERKGSEPKGFQRYVFLPWDGISAPARVLHDCTAVLHSDSESACKRDQHIRSVCGRGSELTEVQ